MSRRKEAGGGCGGKSMVAAGEPQMIWSGGDGGDARGDEGRTRGEWRGKTRRRRQQLRRQWHWRRRRRRQWRKGGLVQRRGGEGLGGMMTCANAEHGQTLCRGGGAKKGRKIRGNRDPKTGQANDGRRPGRVGTLIRTLTPYFSLCISVKFERSVLTGTNG